MRTMRTTLFTRDGHRVSRGKARRAQILSRVESPCDPRHLQALGRRGAVPGAALPTRRRAVRPRLRSLLGNLALAALSVTVALAVLEGVLRFVRSRRQGGKEQDEFRFYQVYDPLLGWRDRPGAEVTFRRREYEVAVHINGMGFRDTERGYLPAPGVFRVLVLGDSFVEGYTVPMDRTVTKVLESRLDRPGCRTEVLNAAVSAYSSDQELLLYREEGSRYRAPVVALFFYYNDVLPNLRTHYFGRPKPLLTFREGPPRVHNFPVPEPTPAPAVSPQPAEPAGGSALFELVQDGLQNWPATYNALAKTGLWRPIRPRWPPPELFVYRREPTPEVDQAWLKTERILKALAAEVHTRAARLVIVYVPSRMEVSDRDLRITRAWYGLDESWGRGAVLRRLRQAADSAGVPVLDLTPAMRKAQGLFGGPYLQYDGHWNARGHRVAGLQLEQFLRENGWVPACPR
jgi:GDSL-like lipase/acylhydrolase family protein